MLPWQLKLHHKKPDLNFALIISVIVHLFFISVPFLIFHNAKIINVANLNINKLSSAPVIFLNKEQTKVKSQSSNVTKKGDLFSKKPEEKKLPKIKEKIFKTKLVDGNKKTKLKKEKKPEPNKMQGKVEPVKIQKAEKIVSKNQQHNQQKIEELKSIEQTQVLDSVIDLAVNEGQIDAIQIAVISAILENWQKPIGFSKDLSCKFKIKISDKGKLQEFLLEELTGIQIYDSEARASLMRTNFPRLTWGMELIIKL